MTIIKEKRQKAFLEQEELKQENLKKKEAIIERIKTMATTPEEANKDFQEFKNATTRMEKHKTCTIRKG